MTELDTRGIRSVMLWMELCLARLHHEKGQRLKDVAAQMDQLFSLGVQLEQKNCITNHDKSPCPFTSKWIMFYWNHNFYGRNNGKSDFAWKL